MEFKYCYTQVCEDILKVDNIGNCFIEAFNDLGMRYYLWIKTELGFSKVLTCGPVLDDYTSPKRCSVNYEYLSYSDSKIYKKIESFLLNPYASITQAFDRQNDLDDCEKQSRLYDVTKFMLEEG